VRDRTITNRKELEARLSGKPRECVRVVAQRAALRVLPLMGFLFRSCFLKEEGKLDLAFAGFRINFILWASSRYPTREMGAVSAAAAAATLRATSAVSFETATPSHASAAFAAAAARDPVSGALAVNAAADLAASCAPARFDAADIWADVEHDLKFLENSNGDAADNASALAGMAVWRDGAPDWAATEWVGLRKLLHDRDLNWDYLCGWYIGRLRGRPNGFSVLKGKGEALDIRVATQPDEWWKRGSEAVNRDIAAWVGVARLGEPREPNISSFVVRFLAGRDASSTINEIREAFKEANYDVLDKTLRGQLSRLASDGRIRRLSKGVYEAVVDGPPHSEGEPPEWAQPIIALPDQPNGFIFRELDNQLAITASGHETDFGAGRDPVTRHLHAEAARRASEFAAIGSKLDNQTGWRGMGLAASRLSSLLAQEPEAAAGRVVELWADVVELGSFLEQDNAIRSGQTSFAEALDPEMRRPLESLVTVASSYVRRYPTAAALDMEAGAFKTGQDLVPQARAIVESARQTGLLNKIDAKALDAVLDTAERSDVQGAKARTVGVQSSRNFAGSAAKYAAAAAAIYGGAIVSAAAPNSILISNGVTFLLASEKAIVEIVKDLPGHVGLAFKAMIEQLKTDPPISPEPPREVKQTRARNEEVDEDSEEAGDRR
jgi:hypothetical protein